METPYITHITADDYKNVYEPAEDSFFLIDTLELDLKFLFDLKPIVCLELGSGSGIVITALAKVLTSSVCFGIDINKHACRISRLTASKNSTNVEIINMDLLSAFKFNSIDVLIFNPPYVLTPDDEISSTSGGSEMNRNIVKSWAGGSSGRNITDKVLIKLHDILTSNGVAYILVIKDNDPLQIIKDLELLNISAVIIADRKIRGEHLFVIKMTRIIFDK